MVMWPWLLRRVTLFLVINLILCGVLYAPQLTCNLISVSSLVMASDLILQFTNNLFLFQDRISRTVIGLGEKRARLYYLRLTKQIYAHKVDVGDSAELWHRRLGHPSSTVVRKLPHVSSTACHTLDSRLCDIFLRGK